MQIFSDFQNQLKNYQIMCVNQEHQELGIYASKICIKPTCFCYLSPLCDDCAQFHGQNEVYTLKVFLNKVIRLIDIQGQDQGQMPGGLQPPHATLTDNIEKDISSLLKMFKQLESQIGQIMDKLRNFQTLNIQQLRKSESDKKMELKMDIFNILSDPTSYDNFKVNLKKLLLQVDISPSLQISLKNPGSSNSQTGELAALNSFLVYVYEQTASIEKQVQSIKNYQFCTSLPEQIPVTKVYDNNSADSGWQGQGQYLATSLSPVKLNQDFYLKNRQFADTKMPYCHTNPIRQIIQIQTGEASTDGHLLTCSCSEKIALVNSSSGQLMKNITALSPVYSLLQMSRDLLLTGNTDGVIQGWNLPNFTSAFELSAHSSTVNCLRKLTDDLAISCSNDQSIKLWSIQSRCATQNFNLEHQLPVVCVEPINSSSFLSASQDKCLKLWASNQPAAQATQIFNQPIFSMLALSEISYLICLQSGYSIILNSSLQALSTYNLHNMCIYQVIKLQSPSNDICCSVSYDKTMKIFKIQNNQISVINEYNSQNRIQSIQQLQNQLIVIGCQNGYLYRIE